MAAIAPTPSPTAVTAAGGDKPAPNQAPFHLQLGGTAPDTDAVAASGDVARPAVAGDAKPAGGKTADKPAAAPATTPTTTATAPPSWLMAMLGGAGTPPTAAAANTPQPDASADDGMPTSAATGSAAGTAAKPQAKAGATLTGAVQPLAAAAGPGATAASPAADTKDADDANDTDVHSESVMPAAPQAAAAAPHDSAVTHISQAEPPAASVPTQAASDAVANLQTFACALDVAGSGTAGSAAPATAAPHTTLNTGQAEWPLALADQVQWQLGREVQEARLELHPRDLGTVQVQVRITSEGAEVRFAATHPQAREALEAALPQLRSLLQGDGIALAQSQVGAQSSWQAPARQQGQTQAGQGGSRAAAEDEEPAAAPRVVRVGLVDDFA